MTKPCRIALLGVGTVGGGVADLLARNGEDIESRTGIRFEIACALARNRERAAKRLGGNIAVESDWRRIFSEHEFDIAVELIGGETDACESMLAAFARNKPVVTANKALLATRGGEILASAAKGAAGIYFEAAVAGCIPAIRLLKGALAGDRIRHIRGIINGTCNYMLTRMRTDGMSSSDALVEAQQLGYAEADPTLDVDGLDAAHKAVIMAWLAFGTPLTMNNIAVTGVRTIAAKEIEYAAEFGFCLKLLANVELIEEAVSIWVSPALVADNHTLAQVEGSMNAVQANADAAGELSLIGAGAGAGPTASAVVSDLVECATDLSCNRVPVMPPENSRKVLAAEMFNCQSYLRVPAMDKPGVMARATGVLADLDISIEAVRQPESDSGAKTDVVFLLHETSWQNLHKACKMLAGLDDVTDWPVLLPIAVPHTEKK